MAKSSRSSRPGDSVPDFSHLAGLDADDEEAPWIPGDEESNEPEAADNPPNVSQPEAASEPEAVDDSPLELPQTFHSEPDAPTKPVGSDAAEDDDEHIFFDTDDPLSEDPEAMAGETIAMDVGSASQLPAGTLDPPEEVSSGEAADARNDATAFVPPGEAAIGLTSHFPSFDDLDDAPAAMLDDKVSAAADEVPGFQVPPNDEGSVDDDPPIFSSADDENVGEVSTFFPAADDHAEDEAPPLFTPVEESPAAVLDASSKPVGAALVGSVTSVAEPNPPKGKAARQPSPASTSTNDATDDDPSSNRRRMMFILLASYASAVTLAWLWMWMGRNTARPHDLESLPDVAPLNENEFRYAPQNASMPKGHVLPLGAEQQLGFIKVQPLRVTRGPAEFVHFSDAAATKPATEPVLKLWLRFTNVSQDQLIAPLDPKLLFTRKYSDLGDTELANQILLEADTKTSGGPMAFVLEHPETSEWDLKGQQLGYRLKPGESFETYIPLAPGATDGLSGALLWRVHFRKGYNPQTGHGVTTMIEVPFAESDIRSDVS